MFGHVFAALEVDFAERIHTVSKQEQIVAINLLVKLGISICISRVVGINRCFMSVAATQPAGYAGSSRGGALGW